MQGGRVWGAFFFVFMSFAAFSTIIAVFENIIGFNLWSSFQPLGAGSNILDLEDFIVSNNILPLGSLVYVLFCTTRYGWGWDNFIEEANMGKGMKFPKWARGYMMVVVPVIILAIFIQGYFVKFG